MARVKKKKVTSPKKLSFRQALMSLTVLGSLWRTAIFAACMLGLILANVADLEMTKPAGAPGVFADEYLPLTYLQWLLMSVIAFFVYDSVYVAISSRYHHRISPYVDRTALLGMEAVFVSVSLLQVALTYPRLSWDQASSLAPYFNSAMLLIFIAALLLPCLRAIVGASYAVAMVRQGGKRRR